MPMVKQDVPTIVNNEMTVHNTIIIKNIRSKKKIGDIIFHPDFQ